ncbi:hypothetical protein Pryu01_01892 [Paraliobacillus ryukyuensis]|uniref:Uncharacterized protein n=2 Tax=Paraliobacillus ryukyuensis TaxID=200904 RepID=A0A366DSS8_9BACI|nr:hypothetical protein [Paraliobacillus ryukyuensis]RBO93142.1 hypothetical protein DES48_1138 [Paraliobacillus ryukyuensis]
MKARTYKIIIKLFSLILLVSCGSVNKMNFYEQTSSTELNEEVNTIKIGSSELEVKEVLGEPDSTEEIENGTQLIYGDSTDSNLEFQIEKGTIQRYFFSDEQYNKNKNVAIGSTRQDIITKYGENYYTRDDSGTEVLGYFDKYKGIDIEFSLDEGKIIGIEVSKINI